jgi:homoserine kinase
MENKYLRIHLRSPASTANLGPGYDCIAIAIDLWNSYEMEINLATFDNALKEFNIKLLENKYYNVDHKMMSVNGNLFVGGFIHARNFFLSRTNETLIKHNIVVLQNNHIPPIRGLGSSSSASVAGVVAGITYINELYPDIDLARAGIKVTNKLILELSRAVDSCPDNICASLMGGLTTVFRGDADSEGVQPIYHFKEKLEDQDLRLVFLIPNKPISTHKARALLAKQTYTLEDSVFNLSRAVCLPKIFAEGRYDLLNEALRDRLHQRQRSSLYGENGKSIDIHSIFKALHEIGAYGACISGAGSSLVAFAHSDNAKHVAKDFRKLFEKYARASGWEIEEIRIHKPVNTGLEQEVFYTY